MMKGIAASSGVGIGNVLKIIPMDLDYSRVKAKSVKEEKARLNGAIAEFSERISVMTKQSKETVGEHQAEILTGQIAMLSDPYMQEQVAESMEAGNCAEAAFDGVCQRFIDIFMTTGDEIMMQRAADVHDMRSSVLGILLGREFTNLSNLPESTVLVTHELTPSMITSLDKDNTAAVVAEVGGFTSHCAILARSMGLPAVLGVTGLMSAVEDGQKIIADGSEGVVFTEPDAEELVEYGKKSAREKADKLALSAFRGVKTHTLDGLEVEVYGNIGSVADADKVFEVTGEGIGLFRTEFLYMNRADLPSEEEQFEIYKRVILKAENKEVIIRTMDIGGDKNVDYLQMEKEDNPFLGFRAIRYCLKRTDIFKMQLRALLRASAFGKLKILLPLITRIGEFRDAKKLIEEIKTELMGGGIRYNKNVAVGVMIETPAACMMADVFAREADFFSIGTNDLTQYIMVADRGNQAVSAIGSPFDPAVLRCVRHIIACGKSAGIPVGMCGEAAANPLLIPILLSFGLNEFSVGAAAVLETRRVIARWSKQEADTIAVRALEFDNEQDVRDFLEQQKR